jgi:MraZ protein
MFTGTHRHTLDQKNRLTVPAKFREELTDGGFVMQGFEQNLMVLTPQAFDVVSRRLNRMSLTNPKARMLRRKIFSSTERFELDKTGRLLIPDFLRQSASLDGEVVLKAAGDYFEIWSPGLLAEQEKQAELAGMDPELFDDLDLATSE